jgi:PAS domain S-box-containing protein
MTPATRDNTLLLEGQNRVLELIAEGRPLLKILDSLLGVMQSQFPGMLCSILLLDPDGIHVRHGAARGLPEAFLRAIDGEAIGPRAGSCGTAAFRREPVIVEDIATDPLWEDYRTLALGHDLRACWSTPIFDAQRRVLGTFAIYFRLPGRPDARHLHLIDVSTHIAAIAISSHQRVEALRTGEERLRLATTAGKADIWEYDARTAHFRWMGRLGEILGWSDGQNLTLESFVEAVHPEDRQSVLTGLRDTIAHGETLNFEFRIMYPDGTVHWFASQGRAEYDMEGDGLRIRGVGIEITERKQAAEEIKRRESQLVEAQRIARLGSYEWDVATNTVRRSDELYRIFGLRPGQFAPTYEGYLARVHPEDRSNTKAIIERAFAPRKPFDFEERIVLPDGAIRILRSQGDWTLDDRLQPIKLVGICQDITERKQAEQQLLDVNAALAEELEERTRAEREIQALTARLIHAQEEERSRLARELHDDLSQQIAALSIAAGNLKKKIGPENDDARAYGERIQQKLIHLAESVRRLSHNLHPAMLEYAGFGAALQSYCAEFSTLTGVDVSFRAEGSFESLPTATALCLYRIAQEALQNVLKHAQVRQAKVVIASSAGQVCLTVSDEGAGIDPGIALASQGLGLVNIKERARLVHGELKIESQPGRGTALHVTVPVAAAE